jgi:hypothetical protein
MRGGCAAASYWMRSQLKCTTLGCSTRMRIFLLVVTAVSTLSQPARAQRGDRVPVDTATLVRFLREFRAAQSSGADSLAQYRALLAFADSLIRERRPDLTVVKVRLIVLAPVITAEVRSAGADVSCPSVRRMRASLADFYNLADFGVPCDECARAARQLMAAGQALDSLARARCP